MKAYVVKRGKKFIQGYDSSETWGPLRTANLYSSRKRAKQICDSDDKKVIQVEITEVK